MKSSIWFGALLLTVLASCSNSPNSPPPKDDTTAAISVAAADTTPPSSPAAADTTPPTEVLIVDPTSTVPGPSYATAKFSSPDGWTYEYKPPPELMTFSFAKSVVTSPPGMAKLVFSISEPYDQFAGTVISTTPGRTAPEVGFADRHVAWRLDAPMAAMLSSDWISFSQGTTGANRQLCRKVLPDDPYYGFSEYPIALMCDVSPAYFLTDAPFSYSSTDMPETVVDSLAGMLNTIPPAFYVGLNNNLKFTFYPNGDLKTG